MEESIMPAGTHMPLHEQMAIVTGASSGIGAAVAAAATRMTLAIIGPNDFSPPTASTGIVSLPLARNALLSIAS
jgi:hypothetical protein